MSRFSDSRRERLREVLDNALEWPADRRATVVAALCASDTALASEAMSLLRALDRAGDLLDPPAPPEIEPTPTLTGVRAGSIEVGAPLGAGGMGVVYEGHDTRLDRRVAVKALPRWVTADPHRRARFENEARALASLQHPNVAAIFGVEDSEHGPLLILELVQGRTLAEVLEDGPLPLDRAVRIASDIARGLEAAHEAGVVHRDLKPANIMLTDAGEVKILDFGAAKSVRTSDTSAQTRDGALVGTVAYMSPEQVRAQHVDRRTDIWALGCVLFEMLAARRAFGGGDADALSAIIRGEPDWDALGANAPPAARRLIARCLAKDPDRRLRDAGDVRLELEDVGASQAALVRAGPSTRGWLTLTLLGAGFTAACGAGAVLLLRGQPTPNPTPLRVELALPADAAIAGQAYGGGFCLAPDGRSMAYVAVSDNTLTLRVQRLDRFETTDIPESSAAHAPCFTPDGQALVWHEGRAGRIMRTTLDSGETRVLATDAVGWLGMAVLPDGGVVCSGPGQGLTIVPEGGGPARPLTVPDGGSGEAQHVQPCATERGEFVLFTCTRSGRDGALTTIEAVHVRRGSRHRVLEDAQRPRLAGGWLFFARGSTIQRVRFDAARAVTVGASEVVVPAIAAEWPLGFPRFDASRSGTLVYLPSPRTYQPTALAWYAAGRSPEIIYDAQRVLDMPVLSPNGRTAAFVAREDLTADLWVVDVDRPVPTRLTTGVPTQFPVWTVDGTQIVYARFQDDGHWVLERVAADGSAPPEQVYQVPRAGYEILPTQSLADGSVLLTIMVSDDRSTDLFLLPGEGGEPRRLFATHSDRVGARLSPDGRFLAYSSMETGRYEVYVVRWPGLDARQRVSTDGGMRPIWGADPGTLFYRRGEAIHRVRLGDDLRVVSADQILTHVPDTRYDVDRTGARFLVVHTQGGAEPQTRLRIITDATNPQAPGNREGER